MGGWSVGSGGWSGSEDNAEVVFMTCGCERGVEWS